MHDQSISPIVAGDSFEIYLSEISKIEGAASLELRVEQKKVVELKFSISEWKRFYTQAIRGKSAQAVPQLVARICGTCSNAHLLASVSAIEDAFHVTPSPQTKLLRRLLYNGLIIRDHALHLYVFALPDLYGKNSILDFDEDDPTQHQLMEDAFAVKEAGNQLSVVIGGRSVHAPYPTVGGFLKLPSLSEVKNLKPRLLDIRPRVLRLIELFAAAKSSLSLAKPLVFSCLRSADFSFLDGTMRLSDGRTIGQKDLGEHLDAVIIPYSQARGFTFDGSFLVTGALARLNIMKESLHPKTRETVAPHLSVFPTNNLFHNNLAQAIEVLHAIDSSCEMIDNLSAIADERPPDFEALAGTGIGVIEAPRGTLYYKLEIDPNGSVIKGDIIVPTGQNQVVMERGIFELVERLLASGSAKEAVIEEIEKFIRAFDPCMSCAAHFMSTTWNGKKLQ